MEKGGPITFKTFGLRGNTGPWDAQYTQSLSIIVEEVLKEVVKTGFKKSVKHKVFSLDKEQWDG